MQAYTGGAVPIAATATTTGAPNAAILIAATIDAAIADTSTTSSSLAVTDAGAACTKRDPGVNAATGSAAAVS